MDIGTLGDGDVAPIAAAVAAWQRDPATHCIYVGTDAASVAEELADEPAWRARTFVARDGHEVAAVVLAAVDDAMGRVWWYGPWGSSRAAATAVLDAAVDALPAGTDQWEFAPDARNELVAALARQHGARRGTGSHLLRLDPLVVADVAPPRGVLVGPLGPTHATRVAGLHDQAFAGSHTTGARLVEQAGTEVLVACAGDDVLGYVAGELQADGSGYVDFLAVAPADRRRGTGHTLVAGLLARWAGARVPAAHLTVREDRPGALALYRRLGFVVERTAVPWRRGFDLG